MNQSQYDSRVWEVATIIKLVAGMDIRSVGIVANNLRRRYDIDSLDDEISNDDIYEQYCTECER